MRGLKEMSGLAVLVIDAIPILTIPKAKTITITNLNLRFLNVIMRLLPERKILIFLSDTDRAITSPVFKRLL